MIAPKLPHIFYGGDYNPEQWDEATWHEDVRLMREAGVNFVTLGVFAWARLEPRPGQYDFAWLDRVMDLLHAGGIFVDLATATASPPPWLAKLHPESLPVTREGVVLSPGGRQHYCPSSVAYREAANALVRQLAMRYREHLALALWHINNEYGCHLPACYCDASAAAFRAWLRARYGTLDALNEAWGTAFWSQRYGDWGEILPPRLAPTFANPTQQLDFARFSSDALLECFDAERAILKELTPDVPVTTNFMGFFKPLDYWTWAAHEDVVAEDSYPDPADPAAHVDAAMRYDLMRSLKDGASWILMEQTPSQVNWREVNALQRPGQMRLWSYQAVARGAEGVLFFQWRASRAGAEKFHGGMVPHIETERSRVWREVTQLGEELARLDELLGARTPAAVAIVLDWESWWGLELDSKPSTRLRQIEQVQRFYRPLYAANIAIDFVRPEADLSSYRAVLVPNLYLLRDDAAPNFERFVEQGGTLMMSFFSGIVDERDQIRLGGYPAPLRRLLGLTVEEFDPYAPGQANTIVTSDGRRYACDLWGDVIALDGAEALATYAADFYAGMPAVTRHAFGRGHAYYLGTRPEPTYLDALLVEVCGGPFALPVRAVPGVELAQRVRGDDRFLFALNHTREPVALALSAPMDDLLTNERREGTLPLGPYGVAILRECLLSMNSSTA
jgi:beta-galactosidase